jgi:hypothetical protein
METGVRRGKCGRRGKKQGAYVPEVVHVGGEEEEHLVDARHPPQRQHEQQVHQVALAQQPVGRTIRGRREGKQSAVHASRSRGTHVSMRS